MATRNADEAARACETTSGGNVADPHHMIKRSLLIWKQEGTMPTSWFEGTFKDQWEKDEQAANRRVRAYLRVIEDAYGYKPLRWLSDETFSRSRDIMDGSKNFFASQFFRSRGTRPASQPVVGG